MASAQYSLRLMRKEAAVCVVAHGLELGEDERGQAGRLRSRRDRLPGALGREPDPAEAQGRGPHFVALQPFLRTLSSDIVHRYGSRRARRGLLRRPRLFSRRDGDVLRGGGTTVLTTQEPGESFVAEIIRDKADRDRAP